MKTIKELEEENIVECGCDECKEVRYSNQIKINTLKDVIKLIDEIIRVNEPYYPKEYFESIIILKQKIQGDKEGKENENN